MSTPSLDTYHLYYHQPAPLTVERVSERAWLLDNGSSYALAATVQARSPEEAWRFALEASPGKGARRRAVVHPQGEPLLRGPLPGDVLVGEAGAWMEMPGLALRPIPYLDSQPWRLFAHEHELQCVCWSPDGRHLATAGGPVSLHALGEVEAPARNAPSYRGHGALVVSALAWSPDGLYIASGGSGCEVHVWRPAPERGGPGRAAAGSIVICRADEEDQAIWRQGVCCIAWSSLGHRLCAGLDSGDVVWWHGPTGSCLGVTRCPHLGVVSAVALSPGGGWVAMANVDGQICLWYSGNGTVVEVLRPPIAGAISALAWSRDGTRLAATCGEVGSSSLYVWDVMAGARVLPSRIPLSVYTTAEPFVVCLEWSPDGRFIAAGGSDGTLQVVEVARDCHVLTCRAGYGSRRYIAAIAWSPDCARVAAACSDARGSQWGAAVRIWQVEKDLCTPDEKIADAYSNTESEQRHA